MSFRVVLGDITEIKCDAIVNFLYENGTPNNRSNVCKAILHRLGVPGDPEYDKYVSHIDSLDLKVGLSPDVYAVKGLFTPKIIDAVVPTKENDTKRGDDVYARLFHVYQTIYRVAISKGLKKIVVPPLGVGTVCHYYPSDSLKAAQTAFQMVQDDLEVTFIMLYRANNFKSMMEALVKDGAREQGAGERFHHPVFPNYYSPKTTNEKINAYVKERYDVPDYLKDSELKQRIVSFVYNDSDGNLRSSQRKLNDPKQTVSARTTWLFACALRMNFFEFMDFYRSINPNPPMSEDERALYCASINWGLSDNIDSLKTAYLAVTGKPLFKGDDE